MYTARQLAQPYIFWRGIVPDTTEDIELPQNIEWVLTNLHMAWGGTSEGTAVHLYDGGGVQLAILSLGPAAADTYSILNWAVDWPLGPLTGLQVVSTNPSPFLTLSGYGLIPPTTLPSPSGS